MYEMIHKKKKKLIHEHFKKSIFLED